jgi:RNA polymerase sigma-70 factor (ECF subfamily)
MADEEFPRFLQGLRNGDESAATQLVHRYTELIRREIRIRLTDPSVFRVHDDEDICQSVLASFFVRAALGQYDLQNPDDLRKLLLRMARNKLSDAGRKQRSQKRGGKQNTADVQTLAVADSEPSPSRVVAGRELLERVRDHLTEDERRVADLRSHGHDWNSIAQRLGGTPDARRMQFGRALNRVGEELGLEESDD